MGKFRELAEDGDVDFQGLLKEMKEREDLKAVLANGV